MTRPAGEGLRYAVSRMSPVWVTFAASIALSVIAIRTGGTLNRDGMLYVEAAKAFLQSGWPAAREIFAWPFFPVLIATVSSVTGLGPETSGHLLNVLFMAGACAFLIASASRLFPEAAWPTILVLLALPGLNDYRSELIREYGCWFFLTMSLWLSLKWDERPRWITAMATQCSLLAAALFRPEALAFYPALILWQLASAPRQERVRRLAMIGLAPMLGLGILGLLFLTGKLESVRLAAEFQRISLVRFNAKAEILSSGLIDYAKDQARTILLFGSLALIPVKFLKKLGLFVIPLLFLVFRGADFREALKRSKALAWFVVMDILVLMVFVTDMQFIAGRYMALLLLLSTPITGYGLWLLMQRMPRGTHVVIGLTVLLMINNVVTLQPAGERFRAAGKWLAAHAEDSPRVYIESARSAYYAGWKFSGRPTHSNRTAMESGIAEGRYELVAIEASASDPQLQEWLDRVGLREITRFEEAKRREMVLIAEPVRKIHQDSDSKTLRN